MTADFNKVKTLHGISPVYVYCVYVNVITSGFQYTTKEKTEITDKVTVRKDNEVLGEAIERLTV